MSWEAMGRFFRSKWMREQSPVIVFCFLIVCGAGYHLFVYTPEDKRENRDAWQTIRKDIQDGYDRHRSEYLQEMRETRTAFQSVHKSDADKYDRLVDAMLRQQQRAGNEEAGPATAAIEE